MGLIFSPLVFHAAIGVWISKTGKINSGQYRFASNRRHTFQRWISYRLVYLFFHILHLHGWFHSDFWLAIVRPQGFATFRPFNAASTFMLAMEGYVWPAFYFVGVMSCVYHFANGLWTVGITWVWGFRLRHRSGQASFAQRLVLAWCRGHQRVVGSRSPSAEDAAAMVEIEDRKISQQPLRAW